jgi:hypothetical protein
MMEQLFEDAKRSIDAVRLQMRNQLKRDLQEAKEKTIARIKPVLNELERRQEHK